MTGTAMTGTGPVRTVLGDVDAADLGAVDYHEHLFQTSPLLPGDELDDETRSGAEAAGLRASGFAAMVDATPVGLGRDPAAVARISAATGLRVVATTGAHREQHYPGGHWLLAETEDRLAARFSREVDVALPVDDRAPEAADAVEPDGSAVRAGVAKAGVGYWSVSAFERRVLAALAGTWHACGPALMVHLEHGSAAFEVLALLAADGVPASAVCLAHVDRNPDPVLHAELAAAGAYLGYDGWARSQRWPDTTLLTCLERAAELGAGERLLLGGDVARRTRYRAYGGMPGLAYLGERVRPRLLEADPHLAQQVLVTNPARWLTSTRPAGETA